MLHGGKGQFAAGGGKRGLRADAGAALLARSGADAARLAHPGAEASAADALRKSRDDMAGRMIERLAASEDFVGMVERNMAPYKRLMTYYECAMMEVETKFRVLDAEYRLQHDRNPIESIKTRLKSTDSLAKKLARKGFPLSVESVEQNIFDVAGVRVVCTFPDDIFSLADALLAQDDVTLIERRDYVANPKPSGYRSLHLIIETPIFLEHEKRLVKVEVQLRTISMNFWASLEHQLRYKKDLDEQRAQAVAAELVNLAEEAANLDERMQALRNYLDDAGDGVASGGAAKDGAVGDGVASDGAARDGAVGDGSAA